MATQPTTRRRVRHRSFAAQFALLLVAVGLATAVVVGAVAVGETQRARTEQQSKAALGAAALAASLIRQQTAAASERFVCEVAGLSSTAQAYAQGGASLETVAQAAVAHASPGQILILLSPSGQVLAGAPSVTALPPSLGSTPTGAAGCSAPGQAGFFTTTGGNRLLGEGVAAITSAGVTVGRAVVLTPVGSGVLSYAQRLANTAGLHSDTALLLGTRLALPTRVGSASYGAGGELPAVLHPELRGANRTVQSSVGGIQYAIAEQSLRSVSGRPIATVLVLESGGGASVSVGDLALPLTLAVAGVLLLGIVSVFLMVEHFLNRPLRRLDIAVQRIGVDPYDATVAVVGGADEIIRLAANFELVRKQLRRQLLIATGQRVIAYTLTGETSVHDALIQVLRSLKDLVGSDLAMILLRPQALMPQGIVYSTGQSGPQPSWSDLERSSGVLGSLIREPRFLVRTHLSPEERSEVEEQIGLRDCLVEPMLSKDHNLGLLVVGNKPKPYIDEDSTFCHTVADQIVVAVEKSTRLEVTTLAATTDEMTGLYNYRFLVGFLDQQVNLAERSGSPLSVLMLDLDHFKGINDSHGHLAGDRLLRQFAGLLVETIRKSDLAVRYGGEEFVVVMANTARDDAEVVADKIRAAVEEMVVRLDDGTEMRITVSLGGVTFPVGSKGARNLLDLADRALYAAKRNGRNRVEFLDVTAPAGEPIAN